MTKPYILKVEALCSFQGFGPAVRSFAIFIYRLLHSLDFGFCLIFWVPFAFIQQPEMLVVGPALVGLCSRTSVVPSPPMDFVDLSQGLWMLRRQHGMNLFEARPKTDGARGYMAHAI